MVGACVLGVAFGFVLQRGGFCGSSLLSSVVLYKEWKGLVGVLVAILVSMLGFALLAQLEWIIPAPKPLRLLSAVGGGLIFGVGMVLAGGCITGTLYKAGEGRVTSMLALLGIAIGGLATNSGALASVKKWFAAATKDLPRIGGLEELVGLSYVALAAIVGAAGLVLVVVVYLVGNRSFRPALSKQKLLSGGWSPITAGALVGVLGWVGYYLSGLAGRNYGLGGQGGVKGAIELLTKGETSSSIWLVWMVAGTMVGSAISARMRGELKLRSADPATLLFALLGGVLVGVGAAIGRGCFIGNSVSGVALLSLHSIVFTVCIAVGNWITTAIYLRGLR
jgi:uncharacterized membrane protein YedE/YeeE